MPVGELRRHLKALPKDAEVVAYCRGPYCVYADDAVRELDRKGFRARRLIDGFPEWKRAGLPVANGKEEAASMAEDPLVDPDALREQVRHKYREVAADPHAHVPLPHRTAARRRSWATSPAAVDSLPDRAVESFAGVGNPFSLGSCTHGERVVDVGSGAGFDSFIAAGQVGDTGRVVGVDMTAEMLKKSRATADALGFAHVEFREGLAEQLPVEDGWADVVISNGVINLCADKQAVFIEIHRVLRPGGCAAVRRHRQRPARPTGSAARHRLVDWLNCRRAAPCGLAEDARRRRLRRRDASERPPTRSAAPPERTRRGRIEVYGYAFLARKP